MVRWELDEICMLGAGNFFAGKVLGQGLEARSLYMANTCNSHIVVFHQAAYNTITWSARPSQSG